MPIRPQFYMALIALSATLLYSNIAIAKANIIESPTLACTALGQDKPYENGKYKSYKHILSGTNGWLFRSRHLASDHFTADAKSMQAFLHLQNAFAAQNTTLIIAYPPTRSMAAYEHIADTDKQKYNLQSAKRMRKNYQKYLRDAQASGLNIIGLPTHTITPNFTYKRDHHWQAQGAKDMADAIAVYLRQRPDFNALPQTHYITKTATQPTKYVGTLAKAYQAICEQKIPAETIKEQQTELTENSDDTDALFGNTPMAEIVLVGTSNSLHKSSKSNFDGALRQALSVDVENHAIAGARIDGPMISYLNSAAYAEKKPKFIIWEIPGYYPLRREKRYIPELRSAVYGSCHDTSLYHSKDIKLTGDMQVLNDKLHQYDLSAGAYYLRFKFDQDIHKDIKFTFDYSGQSDLQKYRRNARIANSAVFYYGINTDIKKPLSKITLAASKSLKGRKVSFDICAYPKK